MAASSTGKFLSDHSTIIDEMSRACELTRQLRSIVLPLPSTDPLSELAGGLFEDILRSFSVIRNKPRSCLHSQSVDHSDVREERTDGCKKSKHSQSVDHSDVREERTDGRKKSRKKLDSWTTLTASPHDDGYQWRKYGQKQINNSSFPRSYYKCAHQKVQGCPATKTVQQEHDDGDTPKFTVTFSKQHTCKINLETSSPFVMDSSSNYKESSTVILESNSGQRENEDPSLNSSVGDQFSLDEMLLSGPVSPVYTPPVQDEIPNVLSPVTLWDLDTDWTTIDELSRLYGFYDVEPFP